MSNPPYTTISHNTRWIIYRVCMSISKETIKKFQLALEEKRGFPVDEKEAEEILSQVVAYYDTLAMIDCRPNLPLE